jgi:hypothetical protein
VSTREYLSVAGALLGTREKVIIAFVVGLLVGWLIIGWGLWPVQWSDAAPSELQQDYRDMYLNMVAFIYETDPSVNVGLMLESWSEEDLERDLNQAYANAPDAASRNRLANLGAALGAEVTGEVQEEEGRNLAGILAVFVIVILAVSALIVLLQLRERSAAEPVPVGGDLEKVTAARTEWAEEEAPMAQFVTSYGLGDDYYDQSFSIETPSGEFLGECGVGISEAIGVGDPKKVTAFEVWLFDKNDIRTVTKVLMTEHCYNDENLREKLAPKGEAVLGEEGTVIELATASLRIEAKVIELKYGTGELPENSFVDRLTIELAAWQMEGAGEAFDTDVLDDTVV